MALALGNILLMSNPATFASNKRVSRCIFVMHVHVLGNILLMSTDIIVEHVMTKCYIFL